MQAALLLQHEQRVDHLPRQVERLRAGQRTVLAHPVPQRGAGHQLHGEPRLRRVQPRLDEAREAPAVQALQQVRLLHEALAGVLVQTGEDLEGDLRAVVRLRAVHVREPAVPQRLAEREPAQPLPARGDAPHRAHGQGRDPRRRGGRGRGGDGADGEGRVGDRQGRVRDRRVRGGHGRVRHGCRVRQDGDRLALGGGCGLGVLGGAGLGFGL
nr:hypothetical protein GCM10025730_07810 [Promicromonospora thailandica]